MMVLYATHALHEGLLLSNPWSPDPTNSWAHREMFRRPRRHCHIEISGRPVSIAIVQ